MFGAKRHAITKHLGNIFKSGEVTEKEVCSILELTSSHVFTQLSDKTTGLYLKDWQKIYGMLKMQLEMAKKSASSAG